MSQSRIRTHLHSVFSSVSVHWSWICGSMWLKCTTTFRCRASYLESTWDPTAFSGLFETTFCRGWVCPRWSHRMQFYRFKTFHSQTPQTASVMFIDSGETTNMSSLLERKLTTFKLSKEAQSLPAYAIPCKVVKVEPCIQLRCQNKDKIICVFSSDPRCGRHRNRVLEEESAHFSVPDDWVPRHWHR